MDIKIKKLEKRDYGKAINFAIKGMNFNKYVDNPLSLYLYGRYFLYLELECATQVFAAYMGNQLVGVLIADMKNETKLYSSFWRKLYVKIIQFFMTVLTKGNSDIYDRTNKIMLEKYQKKANPDGEICFFAVDPTIQGKGIGTMLLDELDKKEKGKLVYLYTDDNCTYPFYEHKGFNRVEEKEIMMEIGGKTVPLVCMLYSKRL